MSKLVPELRTDKNGIARTRWVKPHGETGKVTTPAPVLPPVGSVYKDLIRHVIHEMDNEDSIPERIDPKLIKKRLMRLPRHTLEYISSMRDPWLSNPYLDRILVSTLHNETSPVIIDDLAYIYLNMKHDITHCSGWTLRGFEGEIILTDVLRGIHSAQPDGLDYDFTSDVPLRLRNDDRGSKVIAIINVVNLLLDEFPDEGIVVHNEDTLADTITDEALAQLVVDKHESNEELMELMVERQTVDPLVLSSVLRADANAMRDGFL